MNKNDGVLLVSGGMDSTVLAHWLVKNGKSIIPLFFDYGQHCINKEYETLKKVLPEKVINNLKVIKISEIYKESKSRLIKEANLWEDSITSDDLYLPYRNLLFLSIAAAYAQSIGCNTVYSAFINSNHAKEIDCSVDFFNHLAKILNDYGSVEIVLPFRFYSKYEVAKIGLSLGVHIGETFSCLVNSKTHCGACPNCVDRLDALKAILEERDR
jgi:7-cyano-7-deazaguanine synthase